MSRGGSIKEDRIGNINQKRQEAEEQESKNEQTWQKGKGYSFLKTEMREERGEKRGRPLKAFASTRLHSPIKVFHTTVRSVVSDEKCLKSSVKCNREG